MVLRQQWDAVFLHDNGTNYLALSSFAPRWIKQSLRLEFGKTLAQSSNDQTIRVPGAALGDMIILGVPNISVLPNSNFTAWVSTTDVVTIRFNNYSTDAQDPPAGTFSFVVFK